MRLLLLRALLACPPMLATAGAPAAPGPAPSIRIDERGDLVRLQRGPVLVEVARPGARLRVRDRASGIDVREPHAGGLFYRRGGRVHGLDRVLSVEQIPAGMRLTVRTDEGADATLELRVATRHRISVRFTPPAADGVDSLGERLGSPRGERIYGLTERLRDSPPLAPPLVPIPVDDVLPPEVGSLDRRGEVVEMWVVPTIALYAPFFQTSGGWGLAVDGTASGFFDLAHDEPETLRFEFETGRSAGSRSLAFHVLLGPEHATILDAYTQLVGRPFVPPDFAFRHWRWHGELRTGAPRVVDGVPINAQVADDILRYEAFGLPAGVYLFDRPHLAGNFGFARWEWDRERLPNPEQMLASLRRRGWQTAIWSATWTCGTEPGDNGFEARQLGYLAPGPDLPPRCSNLGGGNFILDVTNPRARDWWRDRIAAFVARYRIPLIKLDRGEEHIPSQADDVWFDGRSGREVRNDYPTLQARLHHDALARVFPGARFAVLTRSAYTGTASHAVFWGGDTAGSELFGTGPGTDLGLRSAIISQQRAAFMGMPIWGSDTGGYYEFKDREVFARWIEFSAFSGIMEIGGVSQQFSARAPWDMPTQPSFDTELLEIYRRYARLREALLPYIVEAAQQARRGMPIVRPMPFFDRSDPKLGDLWDQYLFGPDLLVAPVWRRGERERRVYLPKGRWRSYWDPSHVVRGPQTVTVAAPLDVIPLFVREGGRVPGFRPPARGPDR